jgi:hypothetical protein
MSFLLAPSFYQLNPLLYQSLQNKALVVSNTIMNVFDRATPLLCGRQEVGRRSIWGGVGSEGRGHLQ